MIWSPTIDMEFSVLKNNILFQIFLNLKLIEEYQSNLEENRFFEYNRGSSLLLKFMIPLPAL